QGNAQKQGQCGAPSGSWRTAGGWKVESRGRIFHRSSFVMWDFAVAIARPPSSRNSPNLLVLLNGAAAPFVGTSGFDADGAGASIVGLSVDIPTLSAALQRTCACQLPEYIT